MKFLKKYWWVILLFFVAGIGLFVFLKMRRTNETKTKKGEQNPEIPSGNIYGEDPMPELKRTCGRKHAEQLQRVGYQKAKEEGFADDWKQYYAVKKYTIKPEYTLKHDVSLCDVLGWMYQIDTLEGGSGYNYSNDEELFDAAQFQAAKSKGLVD